jgi:hypothetical protein
MAGKLSFPAIFGFEIHTSDLLFAFFAPQYKNHHNTYKQIRLDPL